MTSGILNQFICSICLSIQHENESLILNNKIIVMRNTLVVNVTVSNTNIVYSQSKSHDE